MALIGRNGIVHAHTDRRHYGLSLDPPELAMRLASANSQGRCASVGPDGSMWRVGFAPGGGKEARSFVIGVTVPEAELFAASNAFERVLLLAIVLTIIVLVIWSLLASRAITAPVKQLVAATRRVAHGDLDVKVLAGGGPELGELAVAFNQMAHDLAAGRERLAHAERDQAWAEMARQVAHEVKNPLQPMRMTAQLLQRARGDKDPRADQVADRLARTVLEQTEALDRIASDFRSFAGIAPAQQTVVRVDPWLLELRDQTARLFEDRAPELGVEQRAGEAQSARDQGPRGRVLGNLVQNAVRWATGNVAVLAFARGDEAVVEVRDDARRLGQRLSLARLVCCLARFPAFLSARGFFVAAAGSSCRALGRRVHAKHVDAEHRLRESWPGERQNYRAAGAERASGRAAAQGGCAAALGPGASRRAVADALKRRGATPLHAAILGAVQAAVASGAQESTNGAVPRNQGSPSLGWGHGCG